MNARKWGSAAVLAAGFLCVAFDAVAAHPADALDEAVRKANAEWAEAMKTGDATVIAAPYTDQAVFVLADGKCLQGHDAIESLYRDGFKRSGVASSTRIVSRNLVRDGDLAYESGYADVGMSKEGKTVSNRGRYLTVWQAQADGQWKIVRNIVLP